MQPLRFSADSCSLGSPALCRGSLITGQLSPLPSYREREIHTTRVYESHSDPHCHFIGCTGRCRPRRPQQIHAAQEPAVCPALRSVGGAFLGLLAQTESYAGALLPTLCLALGCCVTVLLAEALGSGRPGAPPQSGLSLSALFLLPLSLLAVCMAPSLTSPIPAALFALSAAYTVLYPLFLDRAPAPAAVGRSSLAAAAWPLRGCMSMIPLTCMICRAVAESGLRPYYEAFWTGIQCGSLLFVTLCYAVPLIVRSYPGKLPFLLLTLGFGSGLLLPF